MKRIKRMIIFVLLISLLLPNSVFARGNTDNLKNLREKVSTIAEYKKFEGNIKSEYVATEAMTQEGLRLTVAYNLSDIDGKVILIFVADESLNILFSGIVDQNGNDVMVTDFNLKTTEIITLAANDCYTDRCVKDRARISSDPKPGCSQMVGQACTSLLSFPMYGTVLSGLCKAGVWILCRLSVDRVCTSYERVPVCEL